MSGTPHQTHTAPLPGNGRVLANIILIIIICYMVLTIFFAVFFIRDAFANYPTQFETITIGAFIAILGTVLTAMSAVYTANRQSSAAQQVEFLRAKLNSDQENLRAKLNGDLDRVKAQSNESLERLKASLDLTKAAYRELFGAATTYYYTLRALALGSWDVEPQKDADAQKDAGSQKKAEALMIDATRHLLYVTPELREMWLGFWQEAQFIYREASAEPDVAKRPELLKNLIEEEIQVGQTRQNLRDRHRQLEETARASARQPVIAPQAAPAGTP